MVDHMHSAAEQDYLKAIYKLKHETGRATTKALAERLGVQPASVTAMIKRLAEDVNGAYVTHQPYRGVELTPRGEAVALEMLRHHRLLELFLAEHLDMPWDKVHAEAERLEHVISEELEERIAAKLGQPTRDPHGDPIPTRDGAVVGLDDVALGALCVGDRATVTRVPDGDAALLQYLQSIGLIPGVSIVVEAAAPYGDVRTVRIADTPQAVGGEILHGVKVQIASAIESGRATR